MKKIITTVILGLATVLSTSSFSKAERLIPANTPQISTVTGTQISAVPIDGRWSGYYSNSIGTAYFFYALTFYADGTLTVEANGSVGSGTYSMMGERVMGTYTLGEEGTDQAGTYSFTGKVSGNAINGTIGFDASTFGAFVFSVTKE